MNVLSQLERKAESNFFWKLNWHNNHFQVSKARSNSLHETTSSFHSFVTCQVICTQKKEFLHWRNEGKKMINISSLFLLAKIFGLAPYTLQVDVKRSRIVSFFQRIPTFLMIFLYSTLVCSIFWKSKVASEISNTVNWIQVNILIRKIVVRWRNFKHIFLVFARLQFIPNAVIFFIVILSAENSRETIQSVGILIHEMDQKLKLFQVSFTTSHKRIKRLSLFATFRNKAGICVIVIVAQAAYFYVFSRYLLWQQHRNPALLDIIRHANHCSLLLLFLHHRQDWFADFQLLVRTLHDDFAWTSSTRRQDDWVTMHLILIAFDSNWVSLHRWMIELPPTSSLSLKDGFTRVKAFTNIETNSEGIDVIYDIVATVQLVCAKMNSYFGKKVKIENSSFSDTKPYFQSAGDFHDLDRLHLPDRSTILSHQQHSPRFSKW